MNEDACAQVGRRFEDRKQIGVVEAPAVDVRSDLDALELEIAHAALELVDRKVGLLHRERAQPGEPVGVRRDHGGDVVVEERGQVERVLGLGPVVEHHRNRRQHLDVDPGRRAVFEAPPCVPTVVLDLAEQGPVQDHPRATGGVVIELDEPRRAVTLGQIRKVFRKDVRVEIDLEDPGIDHRT